MSNIIGGYRFLHDESGDDGGANEVKESLSTLDIFMWFVAFFCVFAVFYLLIRLAFWCCRRRSWKIR